MRRRNLIGLAALLAGLLALAGCGGSDSSSGSSEATSAAGGEALSRKEFIEQADAICSERAPEREALQQEAAELAEEINAGKDAAREGLADLLDEAADNAKREFDELHALVPPSEDTATVDAMLAAAAAQTALTREGVSDLRETDYEAFTKVTERAGELRDRASRMAREYGLVVCGAESD